MHPSKNCLFAPLPLFLAAALALTSGTAEAAVTVKKSPAECVFEIDGKPFFVEGITYAPGERDAATMERDLADIRSLGANAIRTWGADDKETPRLLAAAEKAGLKVMLGLWLRHGRPGAEGDDSFDYANDAEGKRAQMEQTLRHVRAFKDSPALLCWGIGNEVILNIETEPEKVAYAKFLEEVVQNVKQIDNSHPVASVSAYTVDWKHWQAYCPSLDIYGVNVYGYSAAALPGEVAKLSDPRPYLITEFGVRGEWEIQPDANGVKLDPPDTERYEVIADGWKSMVEGNRKVCLGGFVFHFSDSFDHTGLWLVFKAQGAIRPPYWAARKAFLGEDPTDWPPAISSFLISKENQPKTAGSWFRVRLAASDSQASPLEVKFAYIRRGGWRDNTIRSLEHTVSERQGDYWVRTPDAEGPVKIYALVRDAYPNLSVAAKSIVVGPDQK